jgi:transposase InsO family protein
VKTLFIEPGSPLENGYIESFNGKMRDELLDREIFFTLEEAKTLVARWREEYNHRRPHCALGYRPLHQRPGCFLNSQLVLQV